MHVLHTHEICAAFAPTAVEINSVFLSPSRLLCCFSVFHSELVKETDGSVIWRVFDLRERGERELIVESETGAGEKI